MTLARILAGVALSAGIATSALAQTHLPDTTPPDKYGTPITVPQQLAQPPAQDQDMLPTGKPTRGVIKPPATGDHNIQTPPDAGPNATPVIPPSGNAVPK